MRYLGNLNVPKLTEKEADISKGELILSECFEALKMMKTNKTPGNDGLTKELNISFTETTGLLMRESLDFLFRNGELSTSQKQAAITLIEKKGRERRFIKNRRPIDDYTKDGGPEVI